MQRGTHGVPLFVIGNFAKRRAPEKLDAYVTVDLWKKFAAELRDALAGKLRKDYKNIEYGVIDNDRPTIDGMVNGTLSERKMAIVRNEKVGMVMQDFALKGLRHWRMW